MDLERYDVASRSAIFGHVVGLGTTHRWPQIRDDDREAVLRVLDRWWLGGPRAPEAVGLQQLGIKIDPIAFDDLTFVALQAEGVAAALWHTNPFPPVRSSKSEPVMARRASLG
jgi:hypothetical protein